MIPTNDTSLELLLPRIAAGNERALHELIVSYSPHLMPYILDFTHSPEQAEEVLQDVFLQIWQLRESLTSIHNFRVYIYVIAKNHALNSLRSAVREYARREKWQALQTEDAPSGNDRLDLIEVAIQQLPPQLREVWILSRRQGLSHAAIAEQLNLSKESIAKYVQRANAAITIYVVERANLLLLAILLNADLYKTFF